MKRFYKNFLIISTIAIVLGVTYSYIINGSSTDVAHGQTNDSSLASSAPVSSTDSTSTSNGQIVSDTAFLATLASLKTIKIDTSLFTDDSFKSLKNNAVAIQPVVAGRINPFAPIIGAYNPSNIASVPNIVTDLPTEITDKTVVFNGTVNAKTGVSGIYFEYGPTASMGTIVAVPSQSLVGTFVKNISGFTTKTSYFYRACAKINNISACGSVVTFTTN